jgi:Domain of unknown function (DUF4251)
MKCLNSLLVFLLLAFTAASCSTTKAQENPPVNLSSVINSKNFVFKAETAMPMRGGVQQLSAGYQLAVNDLSIVCDLPFYGRAQTVPIGVTNGGIKFTSKDFTYDAVSNSKGWKITIKPNDVSHVRQLYLTIFTNGTATLDVMNIHRDDISFRGSVR